MTKKKKKPRWELLPKSDREAIENYAQLREEFYVLSDQGTSMDAKRINELPHLVEKAYLKLVNLLIRLRRAAKKTKVVIEHQEVPVPVPAAEPVPEPSEPRYRVHYTNPDGTEMIDVVEAPTPAHAAAYTRRTHGFVKVISITLQPAKENANVQQDPPGPGTPDLGNVGGCEKPDVLHGPQVS